MDSIPDLLHFLPTPILAAAVPTDGAGGTLGGLVFYITVALGFSFLCSVLEAVLLSTSLSHVELEVEKGKRSGLLMQKHKDNVERPISAILTLNTIAHTVGAAGAGAEAVGVFGNEWFGVISAVLTLMILVFSEIIPKTIGATYWKQLNPFAAYAIQLLVVVLYPVVRMLEITTSMLGSHEDGPRVTRSELEVMARISAEEGDLQERENRILTNLLHLKNVAVKDIMTPRTVMLTMHQDNTVQEALRLRGGLPYSRIPVYGENIDDMVGFVLRHDILHRAAEDEHETPLRELVRELYAVPESASVAQVLEEFSLKKSHIFLVIDEYGGTAGLLTMEDAIETLLGVEITDESDLVADLRKMAEQRYQRQLLLLNQTGAINLNPTTTAFTDMALIATNGHNGHHESDNGHADSPTPETQREDKGETLVIHPLDADNDPTSERPAV